MLHIFDLDGTLISGFLEAETCGTCGGEGRIIRGKYRAEVRLACLNMPGASASLPKCPDCKGKGKRFSGHLPYAEVALLPGRLEKLRELALEPGARFAIATNQGGIAMGYQTVDEVTDKLGRACAALAFFYNCPFSVHFAPHHEHAKAPVWRGDEQLLRRRKPGPGMIEEAILGHFQGGDPEGQRAATVYVGDLATDRDAAEAAGVRFEWARTYFGD